MADIFVRPALFFRSYIAHVAKGRSMTSIARSIGVAPSTIMRRCRKVEDARDCTHLNARLARIEAKASQRTTP